jgi:hypothetical protein
MISSRLYRFSIAILVGIVLIHASVWSQEIKQKKVRRSSSKVDAPLPVFKGIERAWHSADAGALSDYAGESRVFLNIRGMGRKGGYFSRPQLYYLFKNMFKNTDQTRFEFVKFHNLDEPGRKVYGIAYRSYKNIRSGRYFRDKVYVTLKKEGARWIVAEIKSTM